MASQNTIILPVDFSELSAAALPWARRMAAVMDAEIHCIYVVEHPHFYGSLDMTTPIAVPTAEEIAQSVEAQLNAFVAEHLNELDPAAVGKVLIGRPSDVIVEYARNRFSFLTLDVDQEIVRRIRIQCLLPACE